MSHDALIKVARPSADIAPSPTAVERDARAEVQRKALRGMGFDEAVQRLAPVQLREDAASVHAAAQRGTSGAGGALPHLGAIQRSFGGHDVSGIKAHSGSQAAEACGAMGAEAYASGSAVAFRGAPDLHTAAHEAAHIVQQRSGVQLSGGVGQVGDGYERHADAVADRVVQGKSAEDLLGASSSGQEAAVQQQAVQRNALTWALNKLREVKLTDAQKKVAVILKEKHGVDVTKVGGNTFVQRYNAAVANAPKATPEQIANDIKGELAELAAVEKPGAVQKKAASSPAQAAPAVQRKEAAPAPKAEDVAAAEAKKLVEYLYPSIGTTLEPDYHSPELQALLVRALNQGIAASKQIKAVLKFTNVTSVPSLASATAKAAIEYLLTKDDAKMSKVVKGVASWKMLQSMI